VKKDTQDKRFQDYIVIYGAMDCEMFDWPYSNFIQIRLRLFRRVILTGISIISFYIPFGFSQGIKFFPVHNDVFEGHLACGEILKDSYGFVWFNTNSGTFKYDGVNMVWFQSNPNDSLSIHHNIMKDLLQDGSYLYLTAWGNGNVIDRINLLDNTVERLSIPNDLNTAHSNIIKLSNGFFITGGEVGLVYFNLQLQKSFFYPIHLAKVLIKSRENQIIVFNTMRLSTFEANGDSLKLISYSLVSGPVYCAEQVPGHIVFGSSHGLFSLDNTMDIPEIFKHIDIRSLLLGSDSSLWIGTMDLGLYRWNLKSGAIQHFEADERTGFLHSNVINSLYEDSDKLLWIGTDAGPFIADLKSKLISTLPLLPGLKGLSDSYLIFEDKLNRVWVSNKDRIQLLDLNSGLYSDKSLEIPQSANCFMDERKENIWLTTKGFGAYRLKFNQTSSEYEIAQHYTFHPEQNDGISSPVLLAVMSDHLQNTWFGNYTSGIDIQSSNGTWTHLTKDQVGGVSISQIMQTKDHNIWIGKWDSGLTKCTYDESGNLSFKYYTPENSSLSSTSISTIVEEDDGDLWVGTMSGGLFHMDRSTEIFTSYSSLPGIQSQNIFGIVIDPKKNLWCSTSKGLACMKYKDNRFRNFTVFDGIPQNSFNFYSSCALSNGAVLFGTTSGIAMADAEIAFSPDTLHLPMISGIKLFNKQLIPGPDKILHQNANLVQELTLPFNQDVLTFEFTNQYYRNPESVLYSYFLKGIDKQWSEAGKTNFVTFTRLPPGTYILDVRSSIDHGYTYSYIRKPLTITILPPWWQTWWFRSLVLLMIAAIIYYIFLQRTQRLLAIQRIEIEKKQALQTERERISRDMHDDLGSGLSAIHLLSNYLSDNAEEKYPEFTSEVNKIRKSSEDLNQSIREIIWTVNTKDDTLSSLALFIRRYAHELQENAKIPIHVQMENPMPEIQLNGVQRKHLFLCVKEAINNAIKHGKPEVINVNIQIENENMISIKIQDNGKGFDLGQSNQRNSGNGLKNIKERMGEIGGLAQFESGEKGTTVLLQIKV